MKASELNTILVALRRFQQRPHAIKGFGPVLTVDEIDGLCERLNCTLANEGPDFLRLDRDWDRVVPTSEETSEIEDCDGIVAHESEEVIVDPETGERWSLCWRRAGQVPPMTGQLSLLPLEGGRRARPTGETE